MKTARHAEELSDQSEQLVTQLNLKLQESEDRFGKMESGDDASQEEDRWSEKSSDNGIHPSLR